MLILFAATVLLAAALLFLVQPMMARMLLPLLGGAPAVWNTALVFYQATLLLGYAAAHAAARRPSRRAQAVLLMALLAAAALALPPGVPEGSALPDPAHPVAWLLTRLLVGVGLPFLALSATSPLLQHWFAATAHARARDPYVLYGASNLGSLGGLLAYPLLVEPTWTLAVQARLWSAAYLALALLVAACAATAWRAAARAGFSEAPPTAASPAVRAGGPLRWLLLAAAPSSLMLSVTTYLSTDLAAVPLLWAVPLALYLGTLALAFAPRAVLPGWLVTSLVPIAVLPLVLVLAAGAHEPIAIVIPTHLAAFAVVALACHSRLAWLRPPPAELTRFYLWVATGGVLGGVLTALVAPLVFTRVAEYPLALVLACLVLGEPTARRASRARVLDLAWPLGLGLATAGLLLVTARGPSGAGTVVGLATLVAASFVRRPVRFALGVGAVLLAAAAHGDGGGRVLHAERGFFGRHRVAVDPDGPHHLLFHGTTLHGLQSLDPARRREPLGYFHPTGPVGQVMALVGAGDPPPPVAVVGLGAGTMACHGRPGQRWTFYELDPAVTRLARDSRYFTFLRDCPPEVEVIPGDARLSLRGAPAGHYRLLVLDAYSSDAPPVHLLTREALRLYLAKLAPGGVLAFNVTNRHLDLAPVLAVLAREAGLVALTRHEPTVSPAERRQGKLPSKWLVMAREASTLAPLGADPRWVPARAGPETPVWTDSYSALLHVLRWR